MLGFLLYLGTISIIPLYFFGFVFLYEVIYRRKEILYNYNRNRQFTFVICLVVILCLLNSLLHGAKALPNFILLPFTVLMSYGLKKEDLKVFVYLTLMEIGVGVVEQILGISSILPSENAVDFAEEELLYFRKAVGLSNGSAAFGIKILFSLFFVFIFKEDLTKQRIIILCLIFYLGIITTFNRTALIVGAFFLFIYLFNRYKRFLFLTIKGRWIIVLFVFLLLILVYSIFDSVIFQLARGGDNVDISGRDEIWNDFLKFIKENLFFGNGSCHLLVPYHDGSKAHAHNSFIQLLADHGIIISLLFLGSIFLKIRKCNALFVVSMFIAGMTQYVVFWGMSTADIFLYTFLCNKLITKKVNSV